MELASSNFNKKCKDVAKMEEMRTLKDLFMEAARGKYQWRTARINRIARRPTTHRCL